MPFTAGQRLLASELNTQMPQQIGSSILGDPEPSITIPVSGSTNGIGLNALQVIWQARSDTSATAINLVMQLNGDTGNHYLWQITQGVNSGTASGGSGGLVGFIQIGTIPAATATANFFGVGQSVITNPASTICYKSCSGHGVALTTTTTGYDGIYGGLWESTAAVTSVTIKALTGNLVAGSMVAVYGL